MLDTKAPEHGEAFFAGMENALRQHGLLDTAYVIGTEQSRRRFVGLARVGAPLDILRQLRDAGEDVASRYFLFEHGRDLDRDKVAAGFDLGVPVVPSINIFHYADLPDHNAAARRDIERMLEFGVTEFQIDSVYDLWLGAPRGNVARRG